MHFARIDHLGDIDIAKPEGALTVAQFLVSLDRHIAGIQNDIASSRAILADELGQRSVVRWRVESVITADYEDSIEEPEEPVSIWLGGIEGPELST